jgi:hypothetical protein
MSVDLAMARPGEKREILSTRSRSSTLGVAYPSHSPSLPTKDAARHEPLKNDRVFRRADAAADAAASRSLLGGIGQISEDELLHSLSLPVASSYRTSFSLHRNIVERR